MLLLFLVENRRIGRSRWGVVSVVVHGCHMGAFTKTLQPSNQGSFNVFWRDFSEWESVSYFGVERYICKSLERICRFYFYGLMVGQSFDHTKGSYVYDWYYLMHRDSSAVHVVRICGWTRFIEPKLG